MKNKLLYTLALFLIPVLGFSQSVEYASLINDWLKGEVKILNLFNQKELDLGYSVLELSNINIYNNCYGNYYRYIQNVIEHSTQEVNYSVNDKVKVIEDSINHFSVYSTKESFKDEKTDVRVLNFKKEKNGFLFKQEHLEKFKGSWQIEQVFVKDQKQFLDECHKTYSLEINELGDFIQAYSDSMTYCTTKIDSIDYTKVIQQGEKTLFRSAAHRILGKKGRIFTIDNNVLFYFEKPLLFMYSFKFPNKKLILKNDVTEIILVNAN